MKTEELVYASWLEWCARLKVAGFDGPPYALYRKWMLAPVWEGKLKNVDG